MKRIKGSHFNKFFRSLVLKSFFATTWIDFPVNVDSLLAGIYFRVGGFFFWIWFLDKLLLFWGVGGNGFRFLLSFNLIDFVFFRTSSNAFYVNKDNIKIKTSNNNNKTTRYKQTLVKWILVTQSNSPENVGHYSFDFHFSTIYLNSFELHEDYQGFKVWQTFKVK